MEVKLIIGSHKKGTSCTIIFPFAPTIQKAELIQDNFSYFVHAVMNDISPSMVDLDSLPSSFGIKKQ